jgi:hypothetical protein
MRNKSGAALPMQPGESRGGSQRPERAARLLTESDGSKRALTPSVFWSAPAFRKKPKSHIFSRIYTAQTQVDMASVRLRLCSPAMLESTSAIAADRTSSSAVTGHPS